MTSDPPPSKVNLVKSGQASYSLQFTRGGAPNATYTLSLASGSLDNGVGSYVDTTGTTEFYKVGISKGLKTETDVNASSGTIERTISLSASLPSSTCTGGYLTGSVSCDGDVNIYTIHAHPVNHHQTLGLANYPDAGTLYFEYAWDSSDGVLSHLDKCQVGEAVFYDTSNGQISAGGDYNNGIHWVKYTMPMPIDQDVKNPTFRANPWDSGTLGEGKDYHLPPAFSSSAWPVGTVTVTSTQFYAFHCDLCMGAAVTDQKNYEVLTGPITITRTITTTSDSAGTYSITKSGLTASKSISR